MPKYGVRDAAHGHSVPIKQRWQPLLLQHAEMQLQYCCGMASHDEQCSRMMQPLVNKCICGN
jgi:hypothetical protein